MSIWALLSTRIVYSLLQVQRSFISNKQMTESHLQQTHPEKYQNFMINKQWVISLPILQSRTSHLEVEESGIHLREATKNRIYIAYQKNTTKNNIIFFNRKSNTRKQKEVKNIEKNVPGIQILLEEEREHIPYQKELLLFAKKVTKSINKQENIDNIWMHLRKDKQRNDLEKCWIQEEIHCNLIYKNHYESFVKNIWTHLQTEEYERIKLKYKGVHKEKTKKRHHFDDIKILINGLHTQLLPTQKPIFYQQHTTLKEAKTWRDAYLSHYILEKIIKKNDTWNIHLQNRIKWVPDYCNIFPHSPNQVSIIYPKELSSSAQNELKKTIKKTNPQRNIIENNSKIFQKQGGIRWETNRANGLFSTRFNSKTFLIKDKNGNIQAGDKEELIKEPKYDIIIDKTNQKIYLGGKKTSTKELHSQSMTGEILLKLLHNECQEINNYNLTRSSYSKNKNNMLGKIILPLKKSVKKYCKKSIKITCTGELHNFIIKKEPDDVNIWRITTIFEEKNLEKSY